MADKADQGNKSLPLFEMPFGRRVEEGWKNFLKGEDRGKKILDFRDETADRIEGIVGKKSFAYIGGASGIDWAMFHSFRHDADGITLFERKV